MTGRPGRRSVGRSLRQLAPLAVALGFSGASAAYCFSGEQVRAKSPAHWVRYLLRHADVVMEAEVVRPWNGGEPEILRAIEIYKGPRQSVFTLGSPDELTTAASPSLGSPAKARRLVALRRTPDGYMVAECDAAALGRNGLTPELIRRMAAKPGHPRVGGGP